jgi:hypothetical protein
MSPFIDTVRRYRGVVAIAVASLSYPLAVAGRRVLDQAIAEAPEYAQLIERVGGWLLGTAIGVVVILPIFYLWNILKKK